MTLRIVVLQPARLDMLEHAAYLSRDNPRPGERLYKAVDAMIGLLSTMPEMGVTRDFDNPGLAGIRMFPVRGFDRYLCLLPALWQRG
jgi:hypothetical protein